jgi:hypothetical protein
LTPPHFWILPFDNFPVAVFVGVGAADFAGRLSLSIFNYRTVLYHSERYQVHADYYRLVLTHSFADKSGLRLKYAALIKMDGRQCGRRISAALFEWTSWQQGAPLNT